LSFFGFCTCSRAIRAHVDVLDVSAAREDVVGAVLADAAAFADRKRVTVTGSVTVKLAKNLG